MSFGYAGLEWLGGLFLPTPQEKRQARVNNQKVEKYEEENEEYYPPEPDAMTLAKDKAIDDEIFNESYEPIL